MKKIFIGFSLLIAAVLSSCTNLDEKYYSELTSDNYFQTKTDIYAALARPYTKWREIQAWHMFQMTECTADHFVVTKKGTDYNGTVYPQEQHHAWNADLSVVNYIYVRIGQCIAYAYSAQKSLSQLDYTEFGLTEADKADHMLQLKCLVAYCYLVNLDLYGGGLPLYREHTNIEAERSTAKETFDLIEEFLLEGIAEGSSLGKKKLGTRNEGWMDQGICATALVRLYFNAIAYIGEDRFDQCAKLCQDILDGKYGSYALEKDDWRAPFGFKNDFSSEIIWSGATDYVYNNDATSGKWDYNYLLHYNTPGFLGISQNSPYNGAHLQPSLDPTGKEYNFNLGKPFARFHDQDLRKQQYIFNSSTDYKGMFLVGEQKRVLEDGTVRQSLGKREYDGKVISFVDQVARFSEVGTKYASTADLLSNQTTGEENSGIRLVKRPIPDDFSIGLFLAPDHVIMRLAEIYYTLAECKYRAGDKKGAADLINEVRKRNFENKIDPDPVTVENLNKYRFLQEWGIEFLGEQRRRTDLKRWGCYTTERWWDHEPSDLYRVIFPIPQSFISAAQATIHQNPGYGETPLTYEQAGIFQVPIID